MQPDDPESIAAATAAFRRRFILFLVIGVSAIFLLMVRPFIVALLVAGLLAGLVYPIYDRLRLWVKSSAGGAVLTVLLVLVLIVLPLLGFLGLVAAEALKVSELARAWFASQNYETAALMQKVTDWIPFADKLKPFSDQFIAKLGELAAEAMLQWEEHDIVRQVRGNGLLLGVSFESPDPAEKNWWYARSVRNRMLNHGVWAISDREDTIRMYPALNMNEQTLLEGLEIMHEAIRYVSEHGQQEGDSPGWPTGVAGF